MHKPMNMEAIQAFVTPFFSLITEIIFKMKQKGIFPISIPVVKFHVYYLLIKVL